MTIGVLPFEDLKKKVHLNTGFFETSQVTEDLQMYVTSGNHDNAGLSIGNLQYNFGPADRAQEWFKYMIDNHVSIVNAAFGANTTELNEFKNVINTYTRANRITWGDSISALVNGEKRALIPPYKDAFGTMLVSPEGKAKYYSMKDAYYWTPSYELFRHLSCESRLSLASLFDTYVNKGRYYPVNLIQADFDAIDANGAIDEIEKERQKNYAINYRGNYDNAVNPTDFDPWPSDQDVFWHGDGVDDGRRGCMANQTGTYYGAVYNPELNFDINQEPATDEKVGAQPINVKLGDITVNDVFLGTTPISKLYLGATLIGGGDIPPVTSSRVPKTQFRTNAGSYAGIPNQSAVTLDPGQPLWIDVQEPFVGCRTYYTLDGSEPTTSSNLYNNALTFDSNTTLKVKTISVFGIAEATKTLTVTTAAALPVTTISPSEVIQNNIPITVTLSATNATTTYYKLGTGTQQTYTGPFQVNQNTAFVQSPNILVTYWSVGPGGTEAEKTITYNTTNAMPGAPVVSVINGNNQVVLDWEPTINTTSYTIFRSTTQGVPGPILTGTQYMSATTWTDTTVTGGTTYYYTVQAGTYAQATNSAQVTANPTGGAAASYRYLLLEGYGAAESGQEATTRLIEFQAWEGATNVMQGAGVIIEWDIPDNSVKPAQSTIKDGNFAITSNTYPFWWTATPNGNIVIDFGSAKALTKLNWFGYSTGAVQRTNRFNVKASNTNNGTDWVMLWDNQTGQAGLQPILPNGYEKVL